MLDKQIYRIDKFNKHIFSKLAPKVFARDFVRFANDYFNGIGLTGVEVGVFKGINAKSILSCLNIDCLYLVDPWCPNRSDKNLKGNSWNSYSQIDYDTFYNIALNNISHFNDCVKIIRDFSYNAVNLIPNDLDFVYLDFVYEYDLLIKELNCWFPKIKEGGILAGYQFRPGSDVVRAVLDFVDKKSLKLTGCDDWIIKKENKLKHKGGR